MSPPSYWLFLSFVVSTSPLLLVEIARGAQPDFPAVAHLHAGGITAGFLSTLGGRFVGVLYGAIAAAPGSGVLMAKEAGNALGFLAYSADLPACYRWVMTRRFLPLGLALLPSLVRPSVWTRSVETAFYPFRRRETRSLDGAAGPEREEIGDRADERRTPNAERRTPNAQRSTLNAQRRTGIGGRSQYSTICLRQAHRPPATAH